MKKHISLYIFIVLCNSFLFSQSIVPDSDDSEDGSNEQSKTLFELSIDDTLVNFFLLGSWTAELGFSAGITWIPQGDGSYLQQDIAPRILRTRGFVNTVDLVTSIFINNNFFFEANFHSGFTDTSILFGYVGNGILRELKFGTNDIGISQYSFLTMAEGISGSPGVSLQLNSDVSEHEFVFRYEASNEVRRTFLGSNEYASETIGISSFIRGKYFLLPDTNPEDLEVWLEGNSQNFGNQTQSDENRTLYRRLVQGQDYGILPESAELSINLSLPLGRILVYYTKNGTPISAPARVSEIPVTALQSGQNAIGDSTLPFSLSEDSVFNREFIPELNRIRGFTNSNPSIRLSDFHRTIDSRRALVLYDPDIFSPFEIQAYYSSAELVDEITLVRSSSGNISRNNSGNTSANEEIEFRSVDGLVQLVSNSAPSNSAPNNAQDNAQSIRYPLLAIDSEAGEFYGPYSQERSAVDLHSLSLQFQSQIGSGIRIPENYLPGSLFVYRNSRLITNYSIIDGLIRFPFNISPIDRILLVYRVQDNSGRVGNLSTAIGNKFFIDENNEIELALGGSFGVADVSANQNIPGANPANIQLTSAYHHNSPEFTARIEAGLGYALRDTNPSYRPQINYQRSALLAVNEFTLFPSPRPLSEQLVAIESLAPQIQNVLRGFQRNGWNNRGEQVYRDLRIADRGRLQGRAELSRAEYRARENVIGPYPAVPESADNISGNLSVLEFRNTGAGWAGYQLANRQSANAASGRLSGIELRALPEGLSGTVHAFVQIGNLNEDLDEDFVLDAQASPEERGFSFSATIAGIGAGSGRELIAGYPGRRYSSAWEGVSEDINNNNRLDADAPSAMISLYLGELSGAQNGRWQSYRYSLSSAESSRFRNAPSLRIILVSEESASGRVFFGNHRLYYNNFASSGANSQFDLPGAGNLNGGNSGGGLSSSGPSSGSNSSAGASPEGSPNEIRLSWSQASPQELVIPIGGISTGLYNTLNIPLNTSELDRSGLSTSQINTSDLSRGEASSSEAGTGESGTSPLNNSQSSAETTFDIALNGTDIASIAIGSADTWQSLRIRFDSRELSLIRNGSAVRTVPFRNAFADEFLNSIRIAFRPPSPSGRLRVQPPEYSDSPGVFSAGGRAELVWRPESAVVLSDSIFKTGLSSLEFNGSVFSEGFVEGRGIDSSIRLRGFLPLFRSDLFFRVYWDFDRELRTNASHSFALQSNPFVRFSESYNHRWQEASNTAEVEHSIEFSLLPASWFSLSTGYEFLRSTDRQNRSWELGMRLGEGFVFRADAEFALNEGNIRLESRAGEGASYFESFAESLAFVDWTRITSPQFKREVSIESDSTLDIDAQLFSLGAELNSEYDSLNILSERFDQDIRLELNFAQGLYLHLEGRQSFFYQARGGARDFGEQIELLFAHATADAHFLAPLYIAGVFADSVGNAYFAALNGGAGTGSVAGNGQGEANAGSGTVAGGGSGQGGSPLSGALGSRQEYFTGLRFGRSVGQLGGLDGPGTGGGLAGSAPPPPLIDLIAPSGFEINVSRTLAWRQGIQSDTRRLESSISWQAVNMFGLFGRQALFSTYESDEFYYDIHYNQNIGNINDWSIGGEFSPSFFGIGPFSQFETSLEWRYSELGETSLRIGLETELTWESLFNVNFNEIFAGFNIAEDDRNFKLEHIETLELQFHALRGPSQAQGLYRSLEAPGFSLLLRHSTSFIFSRIGSFELNAALVYANEALRSYNYEYSHSIGFELNAVLELSF